MRTKFAIVVGAALATVLASSPPVLAQQKTVKQCRAEWSANKAEIVASGKTQRAFVAECRGMPLAARAAPASELGKGQYATEADAKNACRADSIVWVNLRSHAYHGAGSKNYGTTKAGAYMCEKESIAAGFHPARAAKASTPMPAKEGAKLPSNS